MSNHQQVSNKNDRGPQQESVPRQQKSEGASKELDSLYDSRLTPENILRLQQTHGNRHTRNVLANAVSKGGRTPDVQMIGGNKAKFLGTTMTASELLSGETRGHGMRLAISIDAGKKPKGGDYKLMEIIDRPQSVHGVSLAYWEQIVIDYDFQQDPDNPSKARKAAKEGSEMKPFSDIYLHNPAARSFDHPEAGGLTWFKAAEKAAEGKFFGLNDVIVYDKPGILMKAGRTLRRTLKFRIIIKDLAGKQETILATQVVEFENGQLVYMSYSDSKGNSLVRGADDAAAATPVDAGFQSDAPGELASALAAFRKQIKSKKATPFINKELDSIGAQFGIDTPDNLAGASGIDNLGAAYRAINRAKGIEGLGGVPMNKIGTAYFERPAPGGGLLVALVKGKEIEKLYYTDDNASIQASVGYPGQPTKMIPTRKFAEIDV